MEPNQETTMARKHQTCFSCPDIDQRYLEDRAKQEGRSVSNLIAHIIRMSRLATEPKPKTDTDG